MNAGTISKQKPPSTGEKASDATGRIRILFGLRIINFKGQKYCFVPFSLWAVSSFCPSHSSARSIGSCSGAWGQGRWPCVIGRFQLGSSSHPSLLPLTRSSAQVPSAPQLLPPGIDALQKKASRLIIQARRAKNSFLFGQHLFSIYNKRLLRLKTGGACWYMPQDGHWIASFEFIPLPKKVSFSAAKKMKIPH